MLDIELESYAWPTAHPEGSARRRTSAASDGSRVAAIERCPAGHVLPGSTHGNPTERRAGGTVDEGHGAVELAVEREQRDRLSTPELELDRHGGECSDTVRM